MFSSLTDSVDDWEIMQEWFEFYGIPMDPSTNPAEDFEDDEE